MKWIGFVVCFFFLTMVYAFLYPVHRDIKTDVDITKFKYCTQNCFVGYLNQQDAHRCPHRCRMN